MRKSLLFLTLVATVPAPAALACSPPAYYQPPAIPPAPQAPPVTDTSQLPSWLPGKAVSGAATVRAHAANLRQQAEAKRTEAAVLDQNATAQDAYADKMDKDFADAISKQNALWEKADVIILAELVTTGGHGETAYANFKPLMVLKGKSRMRSFKLKDTSSHYSDACFAPIIRFQPQEFFFFKKGAPNDANLLADVEPQQILSPDVRDKIWKSAEKAGIAPTQR
jgi:hypothetical protein